MQRIMPKTVMRSTMPMLMVVRMMKNEVNRAIKATSMSTSWVTRSASWSCSSLASAVDTW